MFYLALSITLYATTEILLIKLQKAALGKMIGFSSMNMMRIKNLLYPNEPDRMGNRSTASQ
jgi:hypothetical protein